MNWVALAIVLVLLGLIALLVWAFYWVNEEKEERVVEAIKKLNENPERMRCPLCGSSPLWQIHGHTYGPKYVIMCVNFVNAERFYLFGGNRSCRFAADVTYLNEVARKHGVPELVI